MTNASIREVAAEGSQRPRIWKPELCVSCTLVPRRQGVGEEVAPARGRRLPLTARQAACGGDCVVWESVPVAYSGKV